MFNNQRGIRMINRSNAFTLAEVLITLGIIGIVAAMTIPTLIAKQRKSVVEVSLKKFYSNINQAVMLSEIDNGDKKTWSDLSDSPTFAERKLWFNTYLEKYLSYLKIDSLSNSYNSLVIYFSDGSALLQNWSNHDYSFYIKAKDISNPNAKRGKDFFVFGFYPNLCTTKTKKIYCDKGFEGYVGETTYDGTTASLYKSGYSRAIEENGWKIPDDYPLKF